MDYFSFCVRQRLSYPMKAKIINQNIDVGMALQLTQRVRILTSVRKGSLHPVLLLVFSSFLLNFLKSIAKIPFLFLLSDNFTSLEKF
jgi:hypothetical protein